MNEELLELMNALESGDTVGTAAVPTQGVGSQPEQELTPDIKQKVPVVNRARKQNRMTGITNFLENPEVQNALISFGQAFSNAGNYSGQPNPIDVIGDIGRQLIQGNAEQRALEAYEAGEPIAESAGRFARPELIADLQARSEERKARAARLGMDERELAQRQQEFEQQIDLQQKQLELQDFDVRNNAFLQKAKLDADVDQWNQRYEILKQEADSTQRYQNARAELAEAQTAALEEGGDTSALVDQGNRFMETLTEQQNVLQSKRSTLINDLNNLDGDIKFLGFNPETGEPGFEVNRRGFNMFVTPKEMQESVINDPNVKQAVELAKELRNTNQQLSAVESDAAFVRALQRARLGGGEAPADGGNNGEGEGNETTLEPEGTVENPVPVTSKEEALAKPPGSIVTIMGQVGRVTERGTFQLINTSE